MKRVTRSPSLFLSVALLWCTLNAPRVMAQVGDVTDILTGVVVDEDGDPLNGVLIEATSLETEITRTARTNARGRYAILFPDGGGQYRLRARLIGMIPQEVTIARQADEDRLVWNVRLSANAFTLDPIEVRATRTPVRVRDGPTPGSEERNLTAGAIASLPIDVADLNVLATLVPGVVGIDETDSTGASFSVAGQRPDANAITLDGLTFGSGTVPQEGLRNTRIITSTYDVSRGRFSGGLIASTSRSGSNRFQGSLNYSLRDDDLAFGDASESPFTRGFTQNQVSGGFGGPIVRNRFFVYVSGQARLRTDPQPTLTSSTPTDLERLGVSPDSVNRFVSIVDRLGAAPGQRLDRNRSNDRLSGLLRVDYLLSNDHTLTLRGDIRGISQEPSRTSPLSLPETGGNNETSGGGVMARLASRIGLHFINQAQVYVSTSRRESNPFFDVPQGRVRVASKLSDGSTGITSLLLGGNRRMPTLTESDAVEVSNELSWLPGRGQHRFKLGARFNTRSTGDILSTNQLGAYAFNSLADFESDNAASFRRTLAPAKRSTRSYEYAVYAGDVWRASPDFQLTYGVRIEGSYFGNTPQLNSLLDSTRGVRTDRLPSEIDVSPRVGFTWTIGRTGLATPPALIVRGGIGRFRSPIPITLVAQSQISTGLNSSESELNCIGQSIPAPDWQSFALDAGNIPAACNGSPGTIRTLAPTAAVFSQNFGAPKAWRASLGVQRSLTGLLRLSVNANYARGVSQYGFRDLNLNTAGGFMLAGEAGRPVFVAPGRVIPATGTVRLSDSRIEPAFGQVLEIGSDLESETKQFTVSLGGITGNGIILQTSYTWSHVRDQSSQSVRFGSGGIGASTTAGNPNLREWSRSSLERRHQFLTTASFPVGPALEITVVGRLNSGRPYTPLVATDINGDGARNDRAFVFDPAEPGTASAVAAGIADLLSGQSSKAAACLRKQLGSLAGRNSCVGPWEGTLDLQMNYRPPVLERRLAISLTTVNLLRGIDELVHGSGNARGWGLRARPDRTLLFVDGFDEQSRQYNYSVNERFGQTNPRANAFRAPFQIGVQVRLTLGPNRRQEALDRLRGRGGGRGGRRGFGAGGRFRGRGLAGRGGRRGGGITASDFLERFRQLLLNPAGIALELRDSLGLNAAQVERLTTMRDSLNTVVDSLATDVQKELEQIGTNQDPRTLFGVIRPRVLEAQTWVREAFRQVRGVLSEDQWNRLPRRIRRAGRRVGG